VGVAQPVSSASASPSQTVVELVVALALVEAGAFWGGIASVEPAISFVNREMPFAAASCATVSPSLAAIPVRVSPGITVCITSA
jgi:hypothetical protein